MKRLYLFLICMSLILIAHAQAFNIIGKVVDESGEPVVSAYVVIKGTKKGTSVNTDGEFKIQVDNGTELEVSAIGYKTQNITIESNNNPLVICLEEKDNIIICDFISYPKTRVVYVEAFGASTMVGANFDSRFKGIKGWGYRLGLNYAYSDNSFFLDYKIKGVAVPLEINYLFGKRKNKFEMGAGVSLGYYKETYDFLEFVPDDEGYHTIKTPKTEKKFGYFCFINIGYRYQPVKGFDFRVGITPSFKFGGNNGINRFDPLPYFSFGYAF